ncbi:hypothetical protein DQ04_05571040 [Trypanosoma grayi]|uniref:hypothetical protein n=1 Tax=Trypanosoma grayi TaxID=71804 RepID=UPI0004F4696D|nr:hypothetical protein DQ04_05571040 [Trypanosoma grayi]KEG09232.1 hypothetical protein DQ04_05571040 [Trypanosoma grayi]
MAAVVMLARRHLLCVLALLLCHASLCVVGGSPDTSKLTVPEKKLKEIPETYIYNITTESVTHSADKQKVTKTTEIIYFRVPNGYEPKIVKNDLLGCTPKPDTVPPKPALSEENLKSLCKQIRKVKVSSINHVKTTTENKTPESPAAVPAPVPGGTPNGGTESPPLTEADISEPDNTVSENDTGTHTAPPDAKPTDTTPPSDNANKGPSDAGTGAPDPAPTPSSVVPSVDARNDGSGSPAWVGVPLLLLLLAVAASACISMH